MIPVVWRPDGVPPRDGGADECGGEVTMRDRDRDRLRTGGAALGVALNTSQLDAFARYADMISDWNSRMNLTRVPPDEYVERHILDSLAACAPAGIANARRIIDVGTGAGLPGVPWKIAYPHLHVTLLDSTRKRLDFLTAVVCELGLDDVQLVHARAEDACREPAHRGVYDVAVARAVAPMDRLAAWLLPFISRQGLAVALKSASAEPEIEAAARAIRIAGGRVERVCRVPVPGSEVERLIVVMCRDTARSR
jgi:16S rRNA (guanine527-N7)-methyltransferase